MAERDVNIKLKATDEASPLVDQAALRMERSLKRTADQITMGNLTASERYKQDLTQLKGHLDAARISEETYNRQLEKTQAAYYGVSQKAKETGEAQQKMASDGKSIFSSMVTGIASVAASYLTLQTAINLTIGLLRDQQEEARKAAEAGKQSEFSLASLAQVADRQDSFQSLQGRAKELYGRGGASTLSEAAQVVFSLKSAGQMRDIDVFEQLASSGVVRDVGGLSQSAAALTTALGQEETGNVRELISKAFAASAASPATVPELLSAAARSGTSARSLKMSDEEILSAVAITATASGSADQGGTQVASLLKSLEKQGGFEGKSLQEAVAEIAGQNLSGEELFQLLGRQEAVTAFRLLQENSGQYATNLQNITAAQDQDLVTERTNMAFADPELAAARRRRQLEAEEELANRQRGALANYIEGNEALEAKRYEDAAQRAHPAMRQYLRAEGYVQSQARGWGRFFMGDDAFAGQQFDQYQAGLQPQGEAGSRPRLPAQVAQADPAAVRQQQAAAAAQPVVRQTVNEMLNNWFGGGTGGASPGVSPMLGAIMGGANGEGLTGLGRFGAGFMGAGAAGGLMRGAFGAADPLELMGLGRSGAAFMGAGAVGGLMGGVFGAPEEETRREVDRRLSPVVSRFLTRAPGDSDPQLAIKKNGEKTNENLATLIKKTESLLDTNKALLAELGDEGDVTVEVEEGVFTIL